MDAAGWAELFPVDLWPGSEAEAFRYLAAEIASLRLLTDTIVTSVMEHEGPVRSGPQIQATHDLLVSLVLDEDLCRLVASEDDRTWILLAAETLCWVLQHQGENSNFDKNIEKLQARLEQLEGLGVAAQRRPH